MKDHNYMASQLLVEWLNNDTMPHATRQQERNAMPRAGNYMTKVKVLLQTLEMAVLSVVRDFTVLVTASYTIVNNNIVPRRFTMDPKAKVKEKVLASLAKLVQFPKAKAKVKRTTPQIGTQTTGQNGIPTGMVPSAITIPTAGMVTTGPIAITTMTTIGSQTVTWTNLVILTTTTMMAKAIATIVQVVIVTTMASTTIYSSFFLMTSRKYLLLPSMENQRFVHYGKAKLDAKSWSLVFLVPLVATKVSLGALQIGNIGQTTINVRGHDQMQVSLPLKTMRGHTSLLRMILVQANIKSWLITCSSILPSTSRIAKLNQVKVSTVAIIHYLRILRILRVPHPTMDL